MFVCDTKPISFLFVMILVLGACQTNNLYSNFEILEIFSSQARFKEA